MLFTEESERAAAVGEGTGTEASLQVNFTNRFSRAMLPVPNLSLVRHLLTGKGTLLGFPHIAVACFLTLPSLVDRSVWFGSER